MPKKTSVKRKTSVKKKAPAKQTLLQEMEPYLKVLTWFFSYPDRDIGLNDLSAAVGISKTTANRVVRQLEAEKFLTVQVMGKIWRIRAVPNHEYVLSRKIPMNLSMVYESGILGKVFENTPNPRAIILFGSYRKGDDTGKSDVDIAVEVVDNEPLEIRNIGTIKVGYRDKVPVNIHIFSRNQVDLNVFANIANGIVLWGFLEVRP